jgi:restriction system protein
MPIPDYQTLMLPVLTFAAERELPTKECVDLVTTKFGLSQDEREQLLPSGKQTTVANRVHWAASYLVQAGLLERPRRGVIVATGIGRQILSQNLEKIDNNFLSRFDNFKEFSRRSRQIRENQEECQTDVEAESATPEEKIDIFYQVMNSTLREELLTRLASSDPTFFEHLIIDLMIAMGYGGAGSGRHLGKTSDGGVDGVINEDPLGLNIVFLQAKRYAADNVIGVDKIREFAGSLDEKGAIKGVFVTTSRFAPQAKVYAERSPKRLILIDGKELSRLLVTYGVGVRTFRTIELKKIDSDYFNTDE